MTRIPHLKCLSTVKSMNQVQGLCAAASPGTHCPMHTALSLGVRIKGVSTLVIGTAECAYYSRNIPLFSPAGTDGLHWTYLLDSKEVVFGFRKGLIQAIKEMDQAGAKVILLLTTCVPVLMGEDMDRLCFELQSEVGAVLLPISLGYFKCGGYQPGYWKTLLALGRVIEKATKKPNVVNILGRSPKEDHIPAPMILPLLEQEKITLRYLAPESTLEDFISAGDAMLSISLSPFMNPLGEYLAKEHHIPLVSLQDVYSIKEIDAAYLFLENLLQVKIRQHFLSQQTTAKKVQRMAAQCLKNRQYISAHVGALQPLPLSVYLTELGMRAIMIHMEEFYPSDGHWRQQLIRQDQNPIIGQMRNEQADAAIVEALAPDVVLGDWGGRALNHPPTVPVLDLYGQVGYERTLTLLSRLGKGCSGQKELSAYGAL
ncbi:nitrogenase cofactor scaffold and assembly-like protein [Clostridiaceae bacterium JG1575]|nr:nitrogenase cofactor scaffold and assembly-like protein [Clostridiaceae bacterium JG1575]